METCTGQTSAGEHSNVLAELLVSGDERRVLEEAVKRLQFLAEGAPRRGEEFFGAVTQALQCLENIGLQSEEVGWDPAYYEKLRSAVAEAARGCGGVPTEDGVPASERVGCVSEWRDGGASSGTPPLDDESDRMQLDAAPDFGLLGGHGGGGGSDGFGQDSFYGEFDFSSGRGLSLSPSPSQDGRLGDVPFNVLRQFSPVPFNTSPLCQRSSSRDRNASLQPDFINREQREHEEARREQNNLFNNFWDWGTLLTIIKTPLLFQCNASEAIRSWSCCEKINIDELLAANNIYNQIMYLSVKQEAHLLTQGDCDLQQDHQQLPDLRAAL